MQQRRQISAPQRARPEKLRWETPPTDAEVAALLAGIAGTAPPTAALSRVTTTIGALLRWQRSGRPPVGFTPDPFTPEIDAFISRLVHSLAADRHSRFAEAELRTLLQFVKCMRGSEAFTFSDALTNGAPEWHGAHWHLLALHTAKVVSEAYITTGLWPGSCGKHRLLARLVHALLVRCGINYSVGAVRNALIERQMDYEVWHSEQ